MMHADTTQQTETGTADIAAQLVAERFTPTTRDPGRARGIAAIHAFAEWLAQHPDVPMPTDIKAVCHPDPRDTGEALEHARHMIAQHGAERLVSGTTGWAKTLVMTEPLAIEHTVFCDKPGTDPHAEEWL